MRTYNIILTGTQPLILHHDDVEWADQMTAWSNDRENKKYSKAGDDRTPAWRWMGCLYREGDGAIVIPTENIMRALMEGGAKVPVPGGKNGKTFKSQSQSGIIPRAIGWPLLVDGKQIQFAALKPLVGDRSFPHHLEAVKKCGFSLLVKRARVNQTKHVRVRPKFDRWSASGQLSVIDDQITAGVLAEILAVAGRYQGLGDWRPGSKTPGVYGMFEATVSAEK